MKYGDIKQLRSPVEWDEFTSYFVGFVLGDGSLIKERIVNFINTDKQIIEEIVRNLGYSLVYECKGSVKKIYRCNVHSLEWYTFMESVGLCPNKSRVGVTLKKIPILNHFVRGLFDSDGCISYPENLARVRFTLLGHSSYISQLSLMFPIKHALYHQKLSVIQIANHSGVENLYHWFYDDATIFMKVKKDKFEHYLNNKQAARDIFWKNRMEVRKKNSLQQRKFEEFKDEKDKLLALKAQGWKYVAEYLGVSIGCAFKVLKLMENEV